MYEIAFLLSYVVFMLNAAAAGSDSSGHTAGSDSSKYEKSDRLLDELEEAIKRKEEILNAPSPAGFDPVLDMQLRDTFNIHLPKV